MKDRCRGCGKDTGIIKYYIIADDLENPKPYHPDCIMDLKIEAIMRLGDIKAQFDKE